MICLAPRALEEIVRPRRLSGVVARPLNFTVSRRARVLFGVGGILGSCARSNTSSARLASSRARNSPSFVSGFLSAIGRLGTPRSKGTHDLASSTSCWRKLTPTLRKAGRGNFEAPRLSAVLGALQGTARGGPLPCQEELRPAQGGPSTSIASPQAHGSGVVCARWRALPGSGA